jgi:hypothetical protein
MQLREARAELVKMRTEIGRLKRRNSDLVFANKGLIARANVAETILRASGVHGGGDHDPGRPRIGDVGDSRLLG